MSKFITTSIMLVLSAITGAQDLRIPSTPAFSILDYEPSAVMRPSSLKQLSTDILNSFAPDGSLQMNVGLEVMPYWLKSRPDLRRTEYLNPDTWQTVKQTFSLSAATVEDTLTMSNNLGVGFRFQLAMGQLTPAFYEKQQELITIGNILVSIVAAKQDPTLTSGDLVINYLEKDMLDDGISQDKVTALRLRAAGLSSNFTNGRDFCDALFQLYIAEQSEIITDVISLTAQRTGIKVEVAGAAKFANNESQHGVSKTGLWINFSNYVSLQDALNLTVRVMGDTGDTLSINTDAGFSYIRQEEEFNIAVEGMLRWYRTEFPDRNLNGDNIIRIDKNFTYRLAAQFSYMLINDISFNLSIGKDFDSPMISKSGFFSILGLNYTLFRRSEE